MTNKFDTFDFGLWVLAPSPFHPYARMRKSAFWSCYSASMDGSTSLSGFYASFPDACGILPTGVQQAAYCEKNCGLFFAGSLPQGGFGGNSSVTTAQVAEALDQTWVEGMNQYPGGCDPTYSWRFAINATRGVYNPQLDSADPLLFGLPKMIYTVLYDRQMTMLNYSNVKDP